MIPTFNKFPLDKNGIYKQMILKSPDVVNYYLKGANKKGRIIVILSYP
jgi:hypothetical protein